MSKIKPGENVDSKDQDVAAGDNVDGNNTSGAPITEPPAPTTDEAKADDKVIIPSPKESVALKGWDNGREGAHTIHLKEGIFTFIDGKAEFSSEAAEALRQAGYIE